MAPAFYRVALKRIVLLMFAYAVCRALFLAWNFDLYAHDTTSDILMAFIHGLRFDLSAILILNAPLIGLWLLPLLWLNQAWIRRLDLTYFAVANTLGIGTGIVDAEFVKFTGKRTSYEILRIREDIQRQAVSIVGTYWYFGLATLALGAALAFAAARFPQAERPRGAAGALAWRALAVTLVIVGIRGGLQLKPMHPMDAYLTTHQEIGLLTLNTPFTMIRSQAHGEVEHANYFASDKEAVERLKAMAELSRPPLAIGKNWNVVILIMESFASEYTGVGQTHSKGYTPFFDSLTREPNAYYFKQNFANARRSIEGLPAVICGLPSIMEAPILTSDFSNNHFECLPRVLGRNGYSTYFLHGAHNGSMHFDTFARIAGFENFVGLNEYPKDRPEDLDHYWGVLDEPMLQYAAETIDRAPKPVMLGLFTLSSHHPYYIPPQYAGKFPVGHLEIHESIGYADYSLKRFFETARTKPWFDHTIFVITADHTQKAEYAEYETLLGYYRVPLLVYIPGAAKRAPKVDSKRITQHIDIPPTILDWLGVTEPLRLLVGQSVFDAGKVGHAYSYTADGYWYLDPQVFLDWHRNQTLVAYSHRESEELHNIDLQSVGVSSGLLNIKAVVHYLSNGLLRNDLYGWDTAAKSK